MLPAQYWPRAPAVAGAYVVRGGKVVTPGSGTYRPVGCPVSHPFVCSPHDKGRKPFSFRPSCLSGRLDSNQRHPDPQSGALPGCATPRDSLALLRSPCRNREGSTPWCCHRPRRSEERQDTRYLQTGKVKKRGHLALVSISPLACGPFRPVGAKCDGAPVKRPSLHPRMPDASRAQGGLLP